MKAALLLDGKQELRRVILDPERTPRYYALQRECDWLALAWRTQWAQGN